MNALFLVAALLALYGAAGSLARAAHQIRRILRETETRKED